MQPTVATHDFDLVVEGEAHVVTDASTVAAMAARWATVQPRGGHRLL